MTRKLIVFEKDISERHWLGEKMYIKFLDQKNTYAIFYNPLVAPKYFNQYLKENNIIVGYEINSEIGLKIHDEHVHTFSSENGVYKVNKGYEPISKRILLIDKGMEIFLSLPTYFYVIHDDIIKIYPTNNVDATKKYCYVEDEDKINEELKRIMLPVDEVVPGVLKIRKAKEKEESYHKKMKKPNNKKH